MSVRSLRTSVGCALPASSRRILSSCFTYNADGRRIAKDAPSESTKFIWDFKRRLQETDAAGDAEKLYTFTTEEYGNLVSERRTCA